MRLHLDFEVFSAVNIKEKPLDVYAADPSTKIILCAYAFDDGPVKVWERPTEGQGASPSDLMAGLRDPSVQLVAWNVGYERTVLRHKKTDIPITRWLDPMVLARYAGLPGRLKDCAKIPMIGVPPEQATKSETLLITKFCMPNGKSKVVEREGGGEVVVPDGGGDRLIPKTAKDLEDWRLFVEYCRKDVQTMRHVLNWLEPRFPFPAKERRIWELDQTINHRGLPVDVDMAGHGKSETVRIINDAFVEMKQLTGLENPNSVQQLLPWLQANGYPYDSLGKEFLALALDTAELTPSGREVLLLRSGAAKASVKKFTAMLEAAGPEVI